MLKGQRKIYPGFRKKPIRRQFYENRTYCYVCEGFGECKTVF